MGRVVAGARRSFVRGKEGSPVEEGPKEHGFILIHLSLLDYIIHDSIYLRLFVACWGFFAHCNLALTV